METTALPKARWVLVHDDGPCANGKLDTPLEGGYCPVCEFRPDMQSTAFIFHCPSDNVRLDRTGKCPACGKIFDKSRD